MSLSSLVQAYDQLILDLDGCVWVGDEPTYRAVDAIAALREEGKRLAFVTNDPRSAGEDYVAKLWEIGVRASLQDVVTVGGAMQHLLAETRAGKGAFVIGTDAIHRHILDAGLKVMNGTDLASRAEVVIVAGTDELVYDDLRNAVLAVRRGADFLATSRDPTYPMPDGLWPGTGAILAAVEYGADREAEIVGKPEPQLMLTALDRLGDGRTLVVGDRLETDVAAARRAGLQAALVLTGGASRSQASQAHEADAQASAGASGPPLEVAENLAELVLAEP